MRTLRSLSKASSNLWTGVPQKSSSVRPSFKPPSRIRIGVGGDEMKRVTK
jgi:hypothetical protein